MKRIYHFYVQRKNRPSHFEKSSHKLKSFAIRLFLPLVGFLALIWFLVRVIPKPSRASYPCQQIAFPLASGFVVWAAGLLGSAVFIRKANRYMAGSRYRIAALCICVSVICLWLTLSVTSSRPALADNPVPNNPIGVAKGIYPGRVVWIHDPNATSWEGSNGDTTGPFWYEDVCTDQTVVNQMLSKALRTLSGKSTDAEAWDALFKNFNQQMGRGDIGYTAGQKIAIKVNFVLMYGINSGTKPWDRYDQIENSPQLARALLRQLIDSAGVNPGDISIGDPSQGMPNTWYDMVYAECPGVVYLTKPGYSLYGRTTVTKDLNAPFYWSDPDPSHFTGVANQDYIPTHFSQADYFINFPVLKSHDHAGITAGGKNHYGSLRIPTESGYYDMHWSRILPGESPGMGHYRANVDLLGHSKLGGKTMLTLLDALYAGRGWDARPIRWDMEPFNGHWPSSIFLSQDKIAIDSVAFDFMYNEWDGSSPEKNPFPHMSGAEDYLHEAAMIPAPPSGTTYDPADDGGLTESLGVHEHWNNATDRQYSRNLGTGDGIELVYYKMKHYAGDLNADEVVDLFDFMYLSDQWLWTGDPGDILEDIVEDGKVDLRDFRIMAENWNPELE